VLNRTGLTGTLDLDLQWTDLTVLLQTGGSFPDAPAPADNLYRENRVAGDPTEA
jgi:hypothetical protein